MFPVVSFLKFVVTELVLFSVVGTDISHLRCGGIFSDSIITNVLLIQTSGGSRGEDEGDASPPPAVRHIGIFCR